MGARAAENATLKGQKNVCEFVKVWIITFDSD